MKPFRSAPILTAALAILLAGQSALCQSQSPPKTAAKPRPSGKERKPSPPEQYAAALVELLKNYQKQLGVKVAAEQAAYVAAAKFYDDAFRTDVFDSLQIDRVIQSQEDARALEFGLLKPEQFVTNLKDYSQHDFDQTKAAYGLGMESYTSYIANLDHIDSNSQKIAALIEILEDLAKKQSLSLRVKDLTAYGSDFVKQYRFSDCSMSDSLLGIAQSRQTGAIAKLDAVNKKIATASDKELDSLTAQKKATTDELAAAESEVTRLQAQRSASGSYTAATKTTAGKCEIK